MTRFVWVVRVVWVCAGGDEEERDEEATRETREGCVRAWSRGGHQAIAVSTICWASCWMALSWSGPRKDSA